MNALRSDAVVVNVFLRDGGSVEALLVHDDGLFSGSLAGLQILDDGVDVGSLEGVALAVVVPVAGEQLFKRPLVAVEAHDDDVLAHAVGDVRLVQSRDSALGHVVVLGVDDVEFLAGVDDGLDDLLGSLSVPLSGLLGHHVPVVVGSDLLIERAGTADLGSMDLAKVFEDLTDVMKRNGISMPSSLTMLARGLATIEGVVADLSTEEGVNALFAAEPRADVVVNNLGIFNDNDFFSVPDSEWMHFYNVNVLSGVRLARHYAQGMIDNGWGRIIFVSSESGVAIPGDMINYGVTKSANLAVSHGLAKRLAGTGVTVNAILHGPTFTEGLQEMLADAAAQSGRSPREQADEFVKTARPSSIIQRAADVEEVANLAVYLASPLSSATTGAALRVDGGVVDTLAM